MPTSTPAKRKQTSKTSAAKQDSETGETPPAPRKGGSSGGKSNALQRPLTPSAELAAVVGKDPLPRTEVVSKVWEYIKSKNLQNPENRREILADEVLAKIFGKSKVSMFEMNKHLAEHLS
ncbi:MAG TPA: SWIB/MDM2 domain-containing protein [Crenalkalicoccus sp.]|jgi:chromatin remodeling complex protein RSC6|nr:SWIB/MDM2 domain-containing protein [Crenalkalicoccus sp.]